MGVPKTQKAKGVYTLANNQSLVYENGGIFVPPCSMFSVESNKEAIASALYSHANSSRDMLKQLTGLGEGPIGPSMPPDIMGCVFARPCPKRPRHGFIESRPVIIPRKWEPAAREKVIEEIMALYKEIMAEDDAGEMILMPYVPAEFNMITTPSMVAVGPSNDGATSGHRSILLPILPTNPQILGPMTTKAGIKNYPYFESVMFRKRGMDGVQGSRNMYYFTQIRDGVKPPGDGVLVDFIPFDLTVKEVVIARGTLLEWERVAELYRGKEGLVVWHQGGNLVSHYAVHCMQNNIPLVCSFKPEVGMELKKKNADLVKKDEPNKERFLSAVAEGLSITNQKGGYPIRPSDAVTLMLYVVHNAPSLDMNNPLHVRVMGYAIGATIKLGAVACMGELRHTGFDHEKMTVKTQENANDKDKTRGQIYVRCLDWPWTQLMETAVRDTRAFGYAGWGHATGPGGQAGVGGIKWFECAKFSWDLWDSVVRFAGDQGSIKDIITALNKVVNVCHNGAKMLTKFTPDMKVFNVASKDPMMIATLAAPIAYVLSEMPEQSESGIVFKLSEFPTFEQICGAWKKIYKAKTIPPIPKKVACDNCGADECDCETCEDCGHKSCTCEK